MLGVKGFSENTRIEVDHKDGRKDDWRVSNPDTQSFTDFQPLCKAANDVKRQICKECKLTNQRWDALILRAILILFMRATRITPKNWGVWVAISLIR